MITGGGPSRGTALGWRQRSVRHAAEVSSHELTWCTAPQDVTAALHRDVLRCWVDVSNAGGAVGFPDLPVSAADVEPTLDALVANLAPHHAGLLTAHDDEELAGWLALTRPRSRLAGHWGSVTRVQTAPACRGTGVGTLLMGEVARCAAEDWGLDHLVLTVRGGTGTERFYERLGWREHGRHPRALRLAPDDLRDEIHLWLPLSG